MTSARKVLDPMSLTVDALAAARLTRLVTTDSITAPLRARVIRAAYLARDGERTGLVPLPEPSNPSDAIRATRDDARGSSWALGAADVDAMVEDDDEPPLLAELVKCRWCTGLWISLGITAARRYAPRAWEPLARALATAAAAGLVARTERAA